MRALHPQRGQFQLSELPRTFSKQQGKKIKNPICKKRLLSWIWCSMWEPFRAPRHFGPGSGCGQRAKQCTCEHKDRNIDMHRGWVGGETAFTVLTASCRV